MSVFANNMNSFETHPFVKSCQIFTPEVCDKLIYITYHFADFTDDNNIGTRVIDVINRKKGNLINPIINRETFNDKVRNHSLNEFIEKVEERDIKIYKNQIYAAFELFLNNLIGVRYNILGAEMQSGKSGTSVCYIFFFKVFRGLYEDITNREIEGVLIFSGVPYTGLRDQWIKDLKLYTGIPKYFKNIKWYQGLLKDMERLSNYIWIHDESYRVSEREMTTNKFFSNQGIFASHNKEVFESRNIYLLSVCATPFAEDINNIRYNQCKRKVILKPGDTYKGAKYFNENNIVDHYYKINWETKDKLIEDLNNKFIEFRNVRDRYGIAMIRFPSIGSIGVDVVKEICKKEKYDLYYDIHEKTKTKDTELFDTQKLRSDTLKRPIVVIICGKYGMGVRLDKYNIAYLHDYISFKSNGNLSSNQDDILQRLFGRYCGYTHINDGFFPKIRTHMDTVLRYIEYIDNNFEITDDIYFDKFMHSKAVSNNLNRSYPFRPIGKFSEDLKNVILEAFGERGNNLNSIGWDHTKNVIKGLIINEIENKDNLNNPLIEHQKLKQFIKSKLSSNNCIFRNLNRRGYRDLEGLIDKCEEELKECNPNDYDKLPKFFNDINKIQICLTPATVDNPGYIYLFGYIQEDWDLYKTMDKVEKMKTTGKEQFANGNDLKVHNMRNITLSRLEINFQDLKINPNYIKDKVYNKLRQNINGGFIINNNLGSKFILSKEVFKYIKGKKGLSKDIKNLTGKTVNIVMKGNKKIRKKDEYKIEAISIYG